MPKVLIIDKEPVVGQFTGETLSELGVDFLTITNFDAVLFLLSTGNYDAVIIDPFLFNEEGNLTCKKGQEILVEIKEKFKNIPIILNTGVFISKEDYISRGLKADGCAIKSYDFFNLIQELGNFIPLDKEAIEKYFKSPNKKVKIFISYAKEDFVKAKTIYEILKQKKYSPWIDKENLLPGQDWKLERPYQKVIFSLHVSPRIQLIGKAIFKEN